MEADIRPNSLQVIPRALIAEQPTHVADTMQEAWGALLRRRFVVVAVFSIVAALGLTITFLRPRVYESAATIMMNPREPEGVVARPDQPFQPPDAGYIDSEVEILRSPELAGRLVDALHLESDREWTNGRSRPHHADVVRAVQQSMRAERQGRTYVVQVAVRSRSPEKAAQMSNALVEIYLASRVAARIETGERTRAWLGQRLVELNTDLQRREGEVEAFRAESGLLTAGGVPLTERQIQEAETSVLMARVELAEREARSQQAQRLVGGAGETMSGALTSEVMAQLREREADVNRRLAEYGDRYGELHPSVVAAQAEKTDIDRQIAAEVGRLSQSLRNEAEVSRARAGTLQAHLASVRAELIRGNAQVVRLNELERGAAGARGVYTAFQQRYTELADGSAGVGGDAQLVSLGVPSNTPVSRSLPLMAALSLLAGLVAGLFVAIAMDKLSTRVQTPEDVERRLGLPILTTIPRLGARELDALPGPESHPGGFVASRPRSAFAESIRLLRSRIAGARPFGSAQTVAIASALPGEGKTTTALSLARVSAMSGRRVVLVDCDLRGGSLNVLLGISPDAGVLQVLRGERNWREVVGVDECSGADIIPAAPDGFTPEDVFGSRAMRALLADLAANYDLVILDCPPVLTLAETRDIAKLAEGVVLVARRGRTSTSALKCALGELEVAGANVIGVALNGVDRNAPGRSSYGDPLYFSHAQKGMYLG